ncbi:MAG: sulfatase [Pseudomonadota bacterium]
MKSLLSVVFLTAFVLADCLHEPVAAKQRWPNLIVIMADDLGYSDVGFNGSTDIPTPHIDSIASNGVRFSSGYTTYTVCSPSRAGLITGRYPQRFGFERNPQYRPADKNMGLPQDEQTLADVLKERGYSTGIIGKWHLGANREAHHPLERGFDEFFGHLGGSHRYFPHELTIKDSYSISNEGKSSRTWIMRDHKPVKVDSYLTDEFSDEAVAFIERHQGKPFFLFLSYNAPHTPLQATSKYLSRFGSIQNNKRRTYAAMVSAMDDGIGRVLQRLKALNLEKDSMIVFLSDNGGPIHNGSRNNPLRGKKGTPYEGGFRVPFALQWPGNVKAGLVIDQPVSTLDIFATMAALCDIEINKEQPLDGLNLMPLLNGNTEAFDSRPIYLRMHDKQAFTIRRGQYKLVIPEQDSQAELYNLNADIGESHDLSAEQPQLVQSLSAQLNAWADQLGTPKFKGLIHTKRRQNKFKKKSGLQLH